MFELGAKITALGPVLAVNVVLLLDLGMNDQGTEIPRHVQ